MVGPATHGALRRTSEALLAGRHANDPECVLTYEGAGEMHTLVIGHALTEHATFK